MNENEDIDKLFMGLWHWGYNRCNIEKNHPDGYDNYQFEIDPDEAKASLESIMNQRVIEELERIDKANKDNGINFWFEDMKSKNNGWRTMRQYVQERIAQLQAKSNPEEGEK